MKHLDKQTADGTAQNLGKLYQLFPSCFTETADVEGNIKRAINWGKLRELLGDNIADGEPEVYDFTWVGKRAAQREAMAPIRKTLRPCPEESVNWDNTQNLYIEGDNLEVLKLLQNSYMGKVKMIYIDPPYNTGNDFVYQDDFHQTKQDFDLFSGDVTEEGERLVRNTESNGRFHSDWCSMIYARLMVARSLLTDDGVIFISIDDNEQKNLNNICNEVFGESNFIAQLATVMNLKGNNDQFGFAGTHEYTLVYAKCLSNIEELNGISLTQDDYEEYKEFDEIGKYKIGATLMRTGEAGARSQRPKGYYPLFVKADLSTFDTIRHDDSDIVVYPKTKEGIEMSWRRSPENLHETRNEFIIRNTSNGISFYKKQRLEEDLKRGKKPKTLFYKPEYSSGNGTAIIKDLFKGRLFDNPKPVPLILDFIKIATKEDSLVLDFFAGSSTTAHAVMQLNAEDGGNRRYIMVQLPEETDEKSEAYKAGYRNICEIGKERMRRASKLISDNHKTINGDLFVGEQHIVDVGFRVFKCADSNMKDVYYTPAEYSQELLLGLEDNIKEDRNDLDLLFGCMLDWGVTLDLPLRSEKVDGVTIQDRKSVV